MSASSFPFFSVKRSFDMRMHAIRDRGQPALPRYSNPGRYMEKHLFLLYRKLYATEIKVDYSSSLTQPDFH